MRARLLLLLPLALLLGGCWDYRGLDGLAIVTGVAVDLGRDNPQHYRMSFEIIDSERGSKESATKTTLVEAEGRTLFETITIANSQLYGELYFGNMEILVVSRQLAESQGINRIVEAILRDNTVREKLVMIISRGETAAELITPGPGSEGILSVLIEQNINDATAQLTSSRSLRIFEIYNRLALGADNLALPAFRLKDEQDRDKPTPWPDGMAVFSGDKLAGFITTEQMPDFLYLTNAHKGGTFVFDLPQGSLPENASVQDPKGGKMTLSISRNSTRLSFRKEGNALTLVSDTHVLASVAELPPHLSITGHRDMEQLNRAAGEALEASITALVRQLQQGLGVDIFGYGDAIYRTEPQVWRQLKDDWPRWFAQAELEVNCTFSIERVGMIRSYGGIQNEPKEGK